MKRFYYLGEEVFPYAVVSNNVYVEGRDLAIDIEWLRLEDGSIVLYRDLVEYFE